MRPGGAACSQESEYPAVVIPVLTQHYPMLQRNLLYTGLTHGRRLVVLVGQRVGPAALDAAASVSARSSIIPGYDGRRESRQRHSSKGAKHATPFRLMENAVNGRLPL